MMMMMRKKMMMRSMMRPSLAAYKFFKAVARHLPQLE
jgi:hypothetical protein